MKPTRLIGFLFALTIAVAACGSTSESASDTSDTDSIDSSDADADAAADADADADAADSTVPDTEPAITPGQVAVGVVEIDGTSLDYTTIVPEGFTAGDTAPLLLAFPPGGQDLGLTVNIMESTYLREANRLGWVVVSPAAPGGERFFDGSEALIPGLLDWVETWVTPENGAPHVIGPSNGGISSFRYAIANPERTRSVIVFPGFPRGDADRAALSNLVDIPVRLYAGETDTVWVENAQTTLDALTELDDGVDAELTVFAGEGHVPSSTRDGTLLFENLESFR